ncbi:DUF3854 domain-containing protein [Desulfobacterota bacterium AH_259_B03_O07]|nr:DUF3854 domain-containing protein [Desulfobacterota bacterium AH_259_B03_O07]
MQNQTASDSIFSQKIPGLLKRHDDKHIKGSGISTDVAKERGYKSVLGRKELEEKGFSKQQRVTPTLLIPIHSVDGGQPFCIHRPDSPRKNSKGKEIKYENPTGVSLRFDVPPRCRPHLKNISKRLFTTEGVKKADALASKGEVAIDLLGVWGFKSKNEFKAAVISADFDYIAWQGRDVYIVFDNDVMEKSQVKQALEVLTEHLRRKEANIYHILIPFNNGKKVGVDDFLLDHSIEELLSHSIKQELSKVQSGPTYGIDDHGYLYREKFVNGANIPVRLSNFDARIVKEIIEDNGVETIYKYQVAGRKKASGEISKFSDLIVSASSFANMNWVHEWGNEAVIEPGIAAKDYLRHAIQTRSTPERSRRFTHTGFREIDDRWEYLTSNGALEREDISVSLPQELNKYQLPSKLTNEVEALKASFSFLSIGSPEITYPLFANIYLSPLTTLLQPMPSYVSLVYGESGSYKTTLAILQLAHFGNFLSIKDLSNFDDTANQLGKRAFTLKDTLMVLDDYHPSTQRYASQQKEMTLQRLIREVANRTERARLNPDTSEKARYSPRCNLLITGEELPNLQSTLARTLVIEIDQQNINLAKLSELQAKSSLLPEAMSSFIYWIRPQIGTIQKEFSEKFQTLRQKAYAKGYHMRLPEQVAFLNYSWLLILTWLEEKKIIENSQMKELTEEGWKAFVELVKRNDNRIRNEDPVSKFVDILQSQILQLKVRLESKDGFGEIGGSKSDNRSEFVGYYDDDFFYFLPSAIWRIVIKYSTDINEVFSASKHTLYKMLAARKLIETKDGNNLVPVFIHSKTRKVLKLLRSAFTNKDKVEEELSN